MDPPPHPLGVSRMDHDMADGGSVETGAQSGKSALTKIEMRGLGGRGGGSCSLTPSRDHTPSPLAVHITLNQRDVVHNRVRANAHVQLQFKKLSAFHACTKINFRYKNTCLNYHLTPTPHMHMWAANLPYSNATLNIIPVQFRCENEPGTASVPTRCTP